MNLKSTRANFFCGLFNPASEAVSKQIHQLSQLFGKFFIYSLAVNQHNTLSFSNHTLKVTPGIHRLFYPLSAYLLERKCDLSHIFYPLSSSRFFLNRLGKKPVVFTNQNSDINITPILSKISFFIFECFRDLRIFDAKAQKAGLKNYRCEVIYPGINLTQWPSSPPSVELAPFKILFASVPFEASYAEARGLNLILAAASKLGNTFEFSLLNRLPEKEARQIFTSPLPHNVKLINASAEEIKALFQSSHAAIAPFTQAALNKSCPLSLLESLACGRPVIATNNVGISDIIKNHQCGVVCPSQLDALCNAIGELKSNYSQYQPKARPCCERNFNLELSLNAYSRVYQQVLERS